MVVWQNFILTCTEDIDVLHYLFLKVELFQRKLLLLKDAKKNKIEVSDICFVLFLLLGMCS